MARQSRWANFADSFGGVYGTLNSAFRNIQMGRAMNAEYKDDQGNALTGDALDKARYSALADIETRYGRAAEGLALRSNQAALQATNFENDLNVEIRPELVRQRGVLQSGLMEAQTNAQNASAANSYSMANERDTLLPGRVTNQGLTNAGLGLQNEQAAFNLGLAQETRPASVALANANAEKATADAEVASGTVDSRVSSSESSARTDSATADITETSATEGIATSDARVEATIADLRAQAAEAGNRVTDAESAARDNSIMADIMSQALQQDFGDDPTAANAWIINQIAHSDMTAGGRLRTATAVNSFGVEQIGSRAAQITQQATEAFRSGGIDAVADLYDNINDGVNGRVVREGDRVSIIVDRGDGLDEVIATATGPDAERIVATQGMRIFQDPMRAMEMAAASLQYEADQAKNDQTRAQTGETQARTSLIDAQTFSEAVQRDETSARTMLIQAQTDQTRQEIDAAKGLGPADQRAVAEIAWRGLASMMGDANFQMLSAEEQHNAVAAYRREFNLPAGRNGAPPGIDPAVWDAMSDEDRALFQQ